MKKYFLTATVISLFLFSCKQSETKVETAENPDGTVTTTTVETNKTTGLDSTKVNATIDKTKENLDAAGKKIDAAADKAGEQLKKAGEDVKAAAAKGAEKVEQGAAKAKEDLQKK